MSYHNLEIERCVLAALTSVDNSLQHVAGKLTVSDFVGGRHQAIFETILQLDSEGSLYDLVMVSDRLQSQGLLDQAGGESYLAEISIAPGTFFNLTAYSERLVELSKRREIDRILKDAQALLKDGSTSSDSANDTIDKLLKAMDGKADQGVTKSISSDLAEFFETLAAAQKGEIVPFVETGFTELDNKAPISNGDLVVVGARPSMGKTTFAQSIVQNVVRNSAHRKEDGSIGYKNAAFFSAEMTRQSIVQRFMASSSSVDFGKIRGGKELSEDEWASLMQSASQFKENYPLFLNDRSFITHQQIRTELNKIRSNHGDIAIVLIDYVQIMGGINNSDKVNSIGDITAQLKAIAKEFNCPVIVLSQLNRGLESRPCKRPVASDLRDSGAIEQDADLIMMLYRDEVYNENTDSRGIAEVIVTKNRNGPVGTVRLAFEGQYSRFSNLIPQMGAYDYE